MEAAVERKTTCCNEPYDETLVVEMNRPNRVRRGRAVAFAGSGKTESVNSLPPSLQTTLTARPFSVAPKTSSNPRNSQFFPNPITTHAANEPGSSVPSYFSVLNLSSDVSPLLKSPLLAFPPPGDIPVRVRRHPALAHAYTIP